MDGFMNGNQRWKKNPPSYGAGLILISILVRAGALAGGASGGTAAAAKPAGLTRAASPATCGAPAIAATVHLAGVKVTSAAMDTSGSYTPPGTTTPITGLPSFCAAQLRQADAAGNAIDIAVWMPVALQ